MRWRVIGLEEKNAFENMSIDEAISESIAKGSSDPTIRFYKWRPGAVSIGRFQSMLEEVNIEACKNLGVDYIRRVTGGGAVYHDINGEITYSIIGPESSFNKGIHESYKEICGYVVNALKAVGIDAVFAPINDIIVKNKKISGSAQSRKNGVLLQHGTILYQTDLKKMFSLLNVSKEKLSDKLIKTAEERVTCVRNENNEITIDKLYEELLKSFTLGKEYYFGELLDNEKELIFPLEEKYKSSEWNFYR